jgi:hypothetical protein
MKDNKSYNIRVNKYKIFENKKLDTMIVELDITKTNLNFRELLKLISSLEQVELSDNDLEVKDIYFK